MTFTGSSSIETRIDVLNSEGRLYCSAFYVMVARDKVSHKARQIPALQIEEDSEDPNSELRFQIGKIRQQERKTAKQNSVYSTPPNSDESKLLHQMFLNQLADDEIIGSNEQEDFVSISDTKAEKTIIKQSQDRNIHGKIFGAFMATLLFAPTEKRLAMGIRKPARQRLP